MVLVVLVMMMVVSINLIGLTVSFSILLNEGLDFRVGLSWMTNLSLWFQDKSWENIYEMFSSLLPLESLVRSTKSLETLKDESNRIVDALISSFKLFFEFSLDDCEWNGISN